MALDDFREELVAKINTITGLSATKYLVEGVNPPCAVIDYELNEAVTFAHGAYQYTWHVGLVHSRHDEKSAQKFFDRHKDPQDTTSLWRTLDDNTWAYADYVRPTSAGQIQQITVSGVDYLLVDFTLEVVL